MPNLTVAAPDGAHFDFEEVRTEKGARSLGEVPILVWDVVDALVANYGPEGVIDIADGTSLRVSFQSIARRLTIAGKSADEVATAQIAFKPGKRQAASPGSQAGRKAKEAIEGGKVNADQLNALLDAINSGKFDLASLGLGG